MRARLPLVAAALWWGSMTALGFVFVPVLFASAPSPAVAGPFAAKLFSAQTWISLGCGMLLLLLSRGNEPPERASTHSVAIVFVVGGMLLALLGEFAVAPRIVSREDPRLWHTVGSAMFFAQWCCAGGALWKGAAQTR